MKVLVVEDSKLHQKVIKKLIHTEYPSAEVMSCHDAYDAWCLLKACDKVELMILDHNMPYAKGGDFIRKIRDDAHFSTMFIVMLTSEDKRDEFLKAGANAYLGKPFDINEFKKVMQDLGT